MYLYTIILTSWEVFNLSLFIQKINVSSRKIPYILKIMRGPVCHNIRTIWDYFSLSKFSFTNFNKLQHTEVYQLSAFFFNFSPFMHHVKRKRNSRFTPRKTSVPHHDAMHNFHAITSIILLFYKSRPEKRANHAITLTTGGASLGKVCKNHFNSNCTAMFDFFCNNLRIVIIHWLILTLLYFITFFRGSISFWLIMTGGVLLYYNWGSYYFTGVSIHRCTENVSQNAKKRFPSCFYIGWLPWVYFNTISILQFSKLTLWKIQ